MGSLSCGMTCMKYLLLAINLVFWIAGISVLGVGIWSRVAASYYEEFLGDSDVDKAANMLIAAGVLVLIAVFVACCGALTENTWALLMCSFLPVLGFLIIILELTAGIMAYEKRDKMGDEIKKAINNTIFKEYGKSDHSKLTKAVNLAQENLKCCGASSYKDWKRTYWGNQTENRGKVVPESCCKDRDTKNCTGTPFNVKNIYDKGCIDGMKDWAKKHLVVIGGIGVGIAIIQILGIMVLSICIFRANNYEKI